MMTDPVVLFACLLLAGALLAALAFGTPSTFLLDLLQRLLAHGPSIRQR